MKKTIAEVKQMIREELMIGVPEYQFRSVTVDFVDSVRQLLRQAFQIANKVLKELEKEAFDLLESKLEKFTQNT
jgi:hypothetical protein